ncbi:hypothetical protein, partial [Klebsiella aerogenes]|uniref:hypothetical protein n=1 Tax=Klebsiella aerogenes TaxID=548 RepID=UPI001953B0CC
EGTSSIALAMGSVYKNIYVRQITAENKGNEEKNVKLFFHQNFYIYGNDIGDTATYYPEFLE